MYWSLLAAGLSLLLLVAFVVFLGPAALFSTLAAADPLVFALGLLAMLATLVCWSEAVRWLLADAGGDVSSWRAFVAYTAAMFGRQIVPMGAVGGPVLTAYAFGKEVALPADRTLAAVTVGEFLSVVASLLLAAVGAVALLFSVPAVPLFRLLVVGAAGFAALLAALALVVWYRRRAVERTVAGTARLLQRTLGRLSARLHAVFSPDRSRDALARFYGTVDALAGNRRLVALAVTLNLVGWLCSSLPLYTSALALDAHVPLALVAFLVPISHLVAVLPLPGGLGGVELALTTVLVALAGLSLPVAGAAVLLYRLCSYWFLLALGALASVYAAVSLSELATDPADAASRR